MNGEEEGQTTITVSRATKDRFLARIGAPKRFKNQDQLLVAMMDCFDKMEDGKEHGSV